MNHFIETYGFKINDHPPFAYLADTLWKQDFLHYLQDENLTVLADLNGEESDKVKVHMSENDISEFAIPFMSQSATILGTHLKKNKVSSIKQIKYVHPGETYSI